MIARRHVRGCGALVALVALATVGLGPQRVPAQQFRRPVACDGCIANWYYFDHDGGGGLRDWACLRSTYDGHRGSDFSLRGGNAAIDAGHDVVAVADGVVVSVQDGHFDRCTSCGGDRCGRGFGFGFGNHVVIDHGERRVIYAHLRTGSVRVGPGDTVRCGQTIGQIGSSGCSTGAHLHLEVRPRGGSSSTAYDPFQGDCSAGPSAWVDQGPHRGMPSPACDGEPPPPTCPPGTYPIWTCNPERTARRRCIDGADETQECPWGCISMPVGVDDECAGPPDADGDGHDATADCDDANASVFPGADDPCGDGVDQDCVGGDAPCMEEPDAGAGEEDGGGSSAEDVEAGPIPAADASIPGADRGLEDTEGGTRRLTSLAGRCSCRAVGVGAVGTGNAFLVVGTAGLLASLRRTRWYGAQRGRRPGAHGSPKTRAATVSDPRDARARCGA
ncbi:MAG: peptidoglycan DD-metalloendopeptidase family protein [Myxococcota bacterium]|nr:peptidoglycan DD-metalloendopeptidase family protein [Myxococcota bacterium]MDW8362492.1 peptidoglycan DD-metalloendopeptidase family protein [Myxococcales bacterium]